MKQIQKGFTLIELMIVVAIIGILAAIAIPAYTDYITRSKWADTVSSVASVKTGISECLDNNGGSGADPAADCSAGTDLAQFGIDAAVAADGGGITSKYGAAIQITTTPAAGSIGIRLDASGVPELGAEDCIFDLVPTYQNDTYVEWVPVWDAGNTACAKYIREASDGSAI